ncbi:MAG: prepilin-type N-terminal cleavage/methylation domain-containing protein [Methylomonas sp.]|jgi:MSHA biogenesis protein MshO
MRRHESGFTLIELVVVLVVVAILSSLTAKIITLPVISYNYLQSRNTLVDEAESALQMMRRDIRRALPNSIRVNAAGTALELLHTSDGGRYRAYPTSAGGGNVLTFSTTDGSFDVLGSLSAAPSGYVVIYNLGELTANAYAGTNIAPLSSSSTATEIVLTTSLQFPMPSPQQRFFIVDTPITYGCNLAAGTLLQYSGYSITSSQTYPPTGATGNIQAQNISNCSFSYSPGSATRAGLIALQLTLTDSYGQTVTLLHQVHVDNAP